MGQLRERIPVAPHPTFRLESGPTQNCKVVGGKVLAEGDQKYNQVLLPP